jgi:hypothetical protein
MIENANPLSVEIYIFDLVKYINYHQDYQRIEIKKLRIIFGHNIIGYSIIVISILLTIVYSLLLSS